MGALVQSKAQNETFPTQGVSNARLFKVYDNPKEDKTDQFELIGFGNTSFSASNVSDGTAGSFNHNVQIVVGLVAIKAGTNSFQLNFYTSPNNVQQAASFNNGVLNIYYPIALYDAIRTKLEQAFAAKRKVIIKVTQKPNGYREGILLL